jgi:exodeoxyribonuclease-3
MVKIYSWNVNGIRAVTKKGLLTPFLQKEQPDILCLQEIKAKPEQIDLKLDGYNTFYYPADKAGYSGTAIISKIIPIKVINGLPVGIIKKYKVSGDIYGNPNLEGRVMAAEFDSFWLITVYTPNAKDDLSRLQLRYEHWDPAFLAYCKELGQTKPVIFCGDLNVAHTADDLANPRPNEGKKGFTSEERAGFQAYIDAGFIDSFRLFNIGNGFYTWWSYFANARQRNVGWRIDYILIPQAFRKEVLSADIYPNYMGSDHCPVSIVLNK